ncbi:hypothetical protein FBZ98_102678 [Rhizobium sp. ERR 922]|nr:hypothetical protein FBZ98_102678 [Rhizobium sp. ERR 922]TWB99748.1 hypothetical protein FBZ97_102678 [Rhizobium sp. ERR 942]
MLLQRVELSALMMASVADIGVNAGVSAAPFEF